MSLLNNILGRSVLFAATASLLASACMQQRSPETLPAPGGKKTTAGDTYTPGNTENPLGQGGVVVSGSNLPLVFNEKSLKQNYALDTANLSYKFSYLDKNEEGALVFAQGKAQLAIKGLKNGQKGDLTLELLEGGIVKLRGVVVGLTLNPGNNSIQLVLKPVDLPPGSTDLTIDVTLEDPGVTSTPPSTTTVPPTTVVTPPPTTVVTPPTSNGGLSFAKAVKPILAKHCTECHHTGFGGGDFSTFPFKAPGSQGSIADKMVQYAAAGIMPPKPRTPLTDAELETLKAWRKEGLNP